ncbi:unnamed protein product [Amaranthus hypochondriacus]
MGVVTMKKLEMVVVLGMMIVTMVGSSEASSGLKMVDENPLYNIILKELESSGSVAESCYGKCKSHADCCDGVSKCATYRIPQPYCEWCPGNGGRCGFFDSCCPGYKCTGGSQTNGVCRPNSWCPGQGDFCCLGISCCPGYKCTGYFNGECTKE